MLEITAMRAGRVGEFAAIWRMGFVDVTPPPAMLVLARSEVFMALETPR